jgi:hypothetical protein
LFEKISIGVKLSYFDVFPVSCKICQVTSFSATVVLSVNCFSVKLYELRKKVNCMNNIPAIDMVANMMMYFKALPFILYFGTY